LFLFCSSNKILAIEKIWEIQAHEGSFLNFKLSFDKKFVYTIGKDGIIKK